jgi:hypothetical protein
MKKESMSQPSRLIRDRIKELRRVKASLLVAPQKLTTGFPSEHARGRLRIFNVMLLAAYFSLLSALRIGWSGLNFGTWISRMQPREYALHATGWVRVASGLQSLISVYLVALTILTYFGTPFEY